MAHFSDDDINAAKRRVQEMQNRASRYTAEEQPSGTVLHSVTDKNNCRPNETDNTRSKFPEKDNDEKEKDNSFFVILALLMLLSKEGADNNLILALLYLLL